MNWAQRQFYNSLWYFNIVLKARQLGFTTFIMLYFLDSCLFNSNHSAGIIAHTKDDAQKIFEHKIKFAYDNLPPAIRMARPNVSDNVRTLRFSNGSSIEVGTSLRGGTFQKLLISEYGNIAARYPEKAKEIKTGALNTVDAGQQIFIESTAEGAEGVFYELCQTAQDLLKQGATLTRLDPKFFFFAWWQNPDYRLTPDEAAVTEITPGDHAYFDSIEQISGQKLTLEQRAWYIKKRSTQQDDMRKEFPSTPEEAFEANLKGALWTSAMIKAARSKVSVERKKTVIAVDPAVTNEKLSDFTGIVPCSLDVNGHGIVEADLSIKASPNEWASRAVNAYYEYEAACIVVEVNQGGDLIETLIHSIDDRIPIKKVRASKGKFARAEPVAALYEQGKVAHAGSMPLLERELTQYVPQNSKKSPDRLDALVWGLTHLMLDDSAQAEPRIRRV
jgi:hypothetical protein